MNGPSVENAKPEDDYAETKNVTSAENAKLEEGSAETKNGSSAETAKPEGGSEVGYVLKAKHTWFAFREITNRQLGAGSLNSQLFLRNYYGSLSCIQKMEIGFDLEEHRRRVNCLNFHVNGELLVSGSDDKKLIVWDWKHAQPFPLITVDTGNFVHDCKFLPLAGEIKIATTSFSGEVIVSQIAQAGPRSQSNLGGIENLLACRKLAVFHDEPQSILTVGLDGYILHHDVRKCSEEKLLRTQDGKGQCLPLHSISGHPLDSNKFCVAGRDYQVHVYDRRMIISSRSSSHSIYHPFETLNWERSNKNVTKAIYNYNGTEILASYNFENIYIFDSTSRLGSYTHCYEGHRTNPGIIFRGLNFFGPKSEFIVSDTNFGVIAFWERNTKQLVRKLLTHTSSINTLESHPTQPILCASGENSKIKVFLPYSK